jgi:hypothetical protein
LESNHGIRKDQGHTACYESAWPKNIQNTLLYAQLVNFENNDYYSATARSVEEAQKLVETGFEYVCTFNDVKLFRKHK